MTTKNKNNLEIKTLKIIFMGTSFFAKEILENLTKKIEVALVVTQPDKLAGRKKNLKPSEVKKMALKKKLPLIQPRKLDQCFIKSIQEIKPDLILVASYGVIIPKKIIDSSEISTDFINIHPSLLPKLRGSAPIQTALLKNLKKTGLTIIKMDAGVDTGDIILQKELVINKKDTYPILEKKLLKLTNDNLLRTLQKYLDKKIQSKPQNHRRASFTKIIKKQDGLISWNLEAKDIYNKFRAYYLWPQIYTFWKNKKKLKKIILTEIKIADKTNKEFENSFVYEKEGEILIQTQTGSLILKKIKPEGKKEMLIKDFINGYPGFLGSYLE